nr:FAR1 DNA binding domain-containing protein [Tanacetum cinerariifolium]
MIIIDVHVHSDELYKMILDEDHDMLDSSIVREHDMGESSMVPDHDMGESSIVRDDLVDNQIVVLPEHLQNHGPTRAHRLKAALVGGYDKVRGTSTDYCNFKRCVNSFIGDRDAQILVDKMCKRKVHVPEFCFEYYTLPSKELVWIQICAITGIDHNQRCVTFGVALLSDKTTESFSWMLEAFLKTHKKQPPFAVTNQDGALRNTVVKMFPDSHHHLCMWHITEKLSGKVLGDLAADNNFRKEFHKLIRSDCEGSVETCIIQQMDKRSNPVIRTTVVLNKMDCSVTCSCGHYNQYGFLCRHVFCVFRIYGIHKTPDVYLNRRWTKNVLPTHLLDKRHIYGPCIEETDTLASQVHHTIEECIGLFRNDTNKLSELLSTIQDLRKKLENEMQIPRVELNKDDLYYDLLDVTVPDKVVIKTPKSIFRSKGTRRIKNAAENSKAETIARTNRKVPFKWCTCSVCGLKGHNKATCKGCSACGEQG